MGLKVNLIGEWWIIGSEGIRENSLVSTVVSEVMTQRRVRTSGKYIITVRKWT